MLRPPPRNAPASSVVADTMELLQPLNDKWSHNLTFSAPFPLLVSLLPESAFQAFSPPEEHSPELPNGCLPFFFLPRPHFPLVAFSPDANGDPKVPPSRQRPTCTGDNSLIDLSQEARG